ncbi:protein FAM92A isoform X1, partial [Clarias magur]
MSRTPDARARDTQTRQIQESITHVEKHFGQLCRLFAAYVRKTARVRDKADELVREISSYADLETPHLKNGLKHFADQLAKVQDYRQAQVERLDAKVVEPLKDYGTIVKLKREELKLTQTARNREAKQMQQLEKTRQRNPSDRQIISQAESELQRATMDATRTTLQLEETIDVFERQKIRDIKKIFGEFVTVEMAFHAKALEVYTTAYQNIQNVDDEADLEVFRSTLHPPDYKSRIDIVRANSKTSLNQTGTSMSKSGTLQPIQPDRMQCIETGVRVLVWTGLVLEMLVRRSGPLACARAPRRAHKRVDSDETAAKCPRLSECAGGDAALFLAASPVSPRGTSAAPVCASRIGQFLLLPSPDPAAAHSALDVDTGEELVCKVFDMGQYQEKIRSYSMLPRHRNIAQLKDILLGERKAYVFQEKDYGDMHTFVKSCKRLPEKQASKLFYQIASAVAHCHQNGIVLGDLKLRKFVFADEK